MSVTHQTPKVVGKHARPNSKWNSSARHPQKAFDQPKGFARGCRVRPKSQTEKV